MTKLPVFLENQDKGGYNVYLDPALNGSDATLQVNLAYEADPEMAQVAPHRRLPAGPVAGDRPGAAQRDVLAGARHPGLRGARRTPPYNPGPEWRKQWSTLDAKQANELLDKIGLTKKDGEGYRLRADGKGRLRIELLTSAAAFIPWTRRSPR